MYKMLEAVVLGQLSKGRRTEAIKARKGRRAAGQDALKKLADAKSDGPEWHNLSPAAKEARKKAMGFGVGSEKESKKKNYTIVHNSKTDPDNFYRMDGQFPYIYIVDNDKLITPNSSDSGSSYTHWRLITDQTEEIVKAIKGTELADLIMEKTGIPTYPELLKAAGSRAAKFSVVNALSDIGSKDGNEYGMINGRYLNNETSVWVFVNDSEADKIVRHLSKMGNEVEKFHVPTEGYSQTNRISSDEDESESEDTRESSIWNEPEEQSKSKSKSAVIGWISPKGEWEGPKSIARPSKADNGANILGSEGYIRLHLFNDSDKNANVQFFTNMVGPEAIGGLYKKLKEYDAKYTTIQYGKSKSKRGSDKVVAKTFNGLGGELLGFLTNMKEQVKGNQKKEKELAAEFSVRDGSLDSFLEDVVANQKKSKGGITMRDIEDIQEMIEEVGVEDFFQALINLTEEDNTLINDKEAVIDYLTEIIRIQKQ